MVSKNADAEFYPLTLTNTSSPVLPWFDGLFMLWLAIA